MNDFVVVLVTAATADEARRIAAQLIERQQAACVNVVDAVRSIYRWEGAVRDDAEVLLIIKTTAERYPEVERSVRELHSYDVPEVIALPLVQGSSPYLEWLTASVRRE